MGDKGTSKPISLGERLAKTEERVNSNREKIKKLEDNNQVHFKLLRNDKDETQRKFETMGASIQLKFDNIQTNVATLLAKQETLQANKRDWLTVTGLFFAFAGTLTALIVALAR